ncbi:MAG: MASE1 domain-containing protein [Planctomycetota bacterium]|nr:MASE1 domain-containing protein [Planctomycetota bacterium]
MLIQIAWVAVVYFVAAKLGLELQLPGTNSSPVWPPTGIAFAAVLLLGIRVWPGIMLGAFAANFLVFSSDLAFGNKLAASAFISVGNTLESVAGAWILYRFVKRGQEFDRAAGVSKFVGAVLVMCLLSCTIGALSVCGLVLPEAVGFNAFWNVWFTWWLGDVAGGLILAPAIIACVRNVGTTKGKWGTTKGEPQKGTFWF